MRKPAKSDILYIVNYADGRSSSLYISASELKGRDPSYPKYWAIKQQDGGHLPKGEIESVAQAPYYEQPGYQAPRR